MDASTPVRFGSGLITLAAPGFSVGQTMRQKPSANRSQHLMGIANGGGFRARDWVITRLTAEHSPDGECPASWDGLGTGAPPVFFHENLGVFITYNVVGRDVAIGFRGVGMNEARPILEPSIRGGAGEQEVGHAFFYEDLVC